MRPASRSHSRSRLALPHVAGADNSPFGFAGDQIFGHENELIVVWNLDGTVVATYPYDVDLRAFNDSGTGVGQLNGETVIWRDGVVLQYLPPIGKAKVWPVAITMDGTVIGKRPSTGYDDLGAPVSGACVG